MWAGVGGKKYREQKFWVELTIGAGGGVGGKNFWGLWVAKKLRAAQG